MPSMLSDVSRLPSAWQSLLTNTTFLLELLLMSMTWPLPYLILLIFFLASFSVWSVTAICSFVGLSEVEVAVLCRSVVCRAASLYCSVMHRQEFRGMSNIPAAGPALLVYYHGPVPVDYYGLVANIYLTKDRMVTSIADKCFMKLPGFTLFKKYFRLLACSRVEATSLLEEGHILGVAPGGVWEALFGDAMYPVLWRTREGFAKVAMDADVPIIPIFTENSREAVLSLAGRSPVLESFWRRLYQSTRLPLVPMYGLFPVHLITHIGAPLHPPPATTPAKFKAHIEVAMENLIKRHQILPGSVFRAVNYRFNSTTLPIKSRPQQKEAANAKPGKIEKKENETNLLFRITGQKG